ncbi:hypothetical protein [Luteolibacter marinus]|uniref:hypothetical protein n=1 Tax=Luteolibacter marinus TaxID=2776705 RepID=UPI0018686761|nr:hypothetical protein [Luteolibacter marinus]
MKNNSLVSTAAVLLLALGNCGLLSAGSVRFLLLDEATASRELGFQDAKGIKKLENLSSGECSAPQDFDKGEGALQLVAMDRESPDGKPVATTVVVPDGMKAPLVLISPDEKEAAGVKALAVEDSKAGFPWGSILFVNTTGQALVIRHGEDETELAATPACQVVKPGGEARNISVQVAKQDDPGKTIYSAIWEHDPNVRKLALVVADADGANLQLKVIPEDRRLEE